MCVIHFARARKSGVFVQTDSYSWYSLAHIGARMYEYSSAIVEMKWNVHVNVLLTTTVVDYVAVEQLC